MPKYQVEVNGRWIGYDRDAGSYYKITYKEIDPKDLTEKEIAALNKEIAKGSKADSRVD